MKKISFLTTLLVCVICFVCTASAATGDMDGDGKINSADARMILRASVGITDFNIRINNISDVDGDGRITAADARLILRTSVGLETLKDKFYITRMETKNPDTTLVSLYDGCGNILSETLKDNINGKEIFRYDYRYTENGILRSIKSKEGLNTFTIKENEKGFETSGRIPGGGYLLKKYTPSFVLYEEIIMKEDKGIIAIRKYDIFGRITEEKGLYETLNYVYNGSGMKVKEKRSSLGNANIYEYREDGRLKKISFLRNGKVLYYFNFVPSGGSSEKSTVEVISSDVDANLCVEVFYEGKTDRINEIMIYKKGDNGNSVVYPEEKFFYEKY